MNEIDKIVEFMNSETENIDTNEIENTLDYIDTQLSETPKIKDLKTIEDVESTEVGINELTDLALKQFSKLDKNTDQIYDLFYGNLATNKDRTDASKVALLDSQRLKVEMISALADLANAKAKLEIAKNKVNTGMGVYVDARPGKEVGISLHNLWEDTK